MWQLIAFHVFLLLLIGLILFGGLLFLMEHSRGRYIRKRSLKAAKESNIGRSGIILCYLMGLFIVFFLSFIIIHLIIRGVP